MISFPLTLSKGQKMKKMLFFFFIGFSCLIAFETQPQELTISQVDPKKQTLILEASQTKFKVGETGIVIHNIGSGIISNLITITQIAEGKIHANFQQFKLLEQKYLPTPIIAPRVGDKVIMRSLYSRAFIVAPNQKLYETIKLKFPHITFVSSDLMVADINNKGIIDPSKEGFSTLCSLYSVGLLMIYASNGLNILDCQSFKILQTQALENPDQENENYPFFARVTPKSFWDSLRSKRHYFVEYDKLLQ